MKYKSEIYEVIYQSAVEKFKIGAISESRMKEYDEMCLAENPEKFEKSEEVKHTGLVTVYS
jgi:DNA-binding transcriptional regulator YiaG